MTESGLCLLARRALPGTRRLKELYTIQGYVNTDIADHGGNRSVGCGDVSDHLLN